MTKLHIYEAKQASRFRELQNSLRDRWESIDLCDHGDSDILIIPSVTLDQRELQKIEGSHNYEERYLFSLIRLRNPRTRLIYITSEPLHPSIIDYYLQLLPGIPFSHARERLLLFATYDTSARPLTEKILERPRLIERIRLALRRDKSYMVCYNSTSLERELSLQLGIPLLASDPDLNFWGTKSGSRQIFTECNIPHPDGSELVWNVDDLALVTAQLWERQPHLQRIVIKLNEGFSGEGNALLDLQPLHKEVNSDMVTAISDSFSTLRFQSGDETWENFSQRIFELGAIAEAFIEGDVKRSPSVQGLINPKGKVEIISTHDQILGGPDGQIFLGCRFPADEAYRLQLQELGMKVGKNLAEKGALDRFGVDFIAVYQGENATPKWDLSAIEINLRRGGTTHPFMTLKLLTNGYYDRTTALFYSQQGRAKFYKATDNLQKSPYRGLLPNDLMDIIAFNQLHFDSCTETGTVFHMMGCLSQFGKLGLTSIGNSPEQAEEIYQKVVNDLDISCQTSSKFGVQHFGFSSF
ncbi:MULTISPECIES: peptide ligase PGM1-related protein [Okeania]|uniref:Carboxylate-amine ligase n=1 Tax=Okeania hirsuta TaxID=1458930 RepID=A0A3N6PBP1_9CYAN|nr:MULTISPECIES: peptide ligase PGM1-related protein [Okeania]NES91173.1 carboxylate-amine ligase [Okeania sp. SIO2B9]NET75998.1 carboxylate-amine ligase [Okeania sp. SIO1F9]RQH42157.1 carboxylate-amine ligase [Okeania hirsuta]